MTYGIVGYLGHGGLPSGLITPLWNPAVVSVFDISMATPDIICVEVRDAQITRGSLVNFGTSQGTASQVITRTNPNAGGATQTGVVCGPGQTYVRFNDIGPAAFLNRTTVDTLANWSSSSLGGRTITAIYDRITQPRESAQSFPVSVGSSVDFVVMSHFIYLQLSSSMTAGTGFTLVNAAFPTVTFNWNDKVIRASSIHATQTGHRAADGRKLASVSQWIPGFGTEGRVDFVGSYGFNTAYIIDSSGNIKYTMTTAGGQITQKNDGVTLETTIDDGIHPIYTASTTTAAKVITAITNANPGVATITGHGYSTGQLKTLRGIGGMSSLENLTIKVGTTTANTFQLLNPDGTNRDTTSAGTFNTSSFVTGFNGLCYNSVLGNHSLTIVSQCDYSGWTTGTPGTYYVYVPGLGVSYPFQIGESIHYLSAKQSMKGYYNQLWGTALSSAIGGVDRPVNFKDGVNGVVINLSKLPGELSTERGSGVRGAIDPALGASSPWITATRMTGWYGGWSDAGDWDYHIMRHFYGLYSLLEWGHDRLPSGVKNNTQFGFPKMTTLLDATTYAGTDSLSDAVHMAVYYLDVFRRFQDASGWVVSGFGYSTTGGGSVIEPSFISTATGYCHAGDHPSSFAYAYIAAKIARVFKDAGFTTLASIWQTSAVNAFNWANGIWSDINTNGVTGTVASAYYGAAGLDLQTKMGWTTTQYNNALTDIQANCGSDDHSGVRIAAFAALYRLTGDFATYGNQIYIHNSLNTGGLSTEFWAVNEYIQTTDLVTRADTGHGTGASQISGYIATLTNQVDVQAQSGLNAAGRVSSYEFVESNNFFNGFGSDAALFALVNNSPSQSSKYLKLIHSGGNFMNGGNQQNLCTTTGLGSNPPGSTLVRDREAMGLSSAQWPGVSPYTWWWDNTTGGGFACLAASNSSINFTVATPTVANDEKLVEPYFLSMPSMQQYHGVTFVVFETEFTTQDTIIPRFISELWRWSWDGNTSVVG